MAVNTKKISGLAELNKISGSEYLLVAKDNRSYKAKASLFTSDKIESITQNIAKGDEAVSTIDMTVSSGDKYSFTVKNGSKGSDGVQGKKGPQGDPGTAAAVIYNVSPESVIINTLTGKSEDGTKTYTENELATSGLSAYQGAVLNNKLFNLEEEYITQEEYDLRATQNRIYDNVKYFITEE